MTVGGVVHWMEEPPPPPTPPQLIFPESSRKIKKGKNYTAVSTKVVQKKAYATVLKGSLGNTQEILMKAQNPFCFF